MWRRFFSRKSYQHLNEVTVSAAALKNNFQVFARLQPNCQVAPVLKSNAYGHGLVTVAKMVDDLHAPFLIVDSLHEAFELKKNGMKTSILIMGFTHPNNFEHKKLPFSTVVSSWKMIEHLHRFQPQMGLHLKIDSGMNRQGVKMNELPALLHKMQQLPNLKLEGICSHLADADNPVSDAFTKRQLADFQQAIKLVEAAGFRPKWKHSSASAGTTKFQETSANLVRLGLGLYGISPLAVTDAAHKKLQSLQPALELISTVAQIKTIAAGEKVGYGLTFTTQKSMTLAILPIGYYDGVDLRLSNKGVVTIKETPCPIIGRISMNMMVVDVSSVPAVKVGDPVTIYSANPTAPNSISAAAQTAGTIPYELLVHLAQSTYRRTV